MYVNSGADPGRSECAAASLCHYYRYYVCDLVHVDVNHVTYSLSADWSTGMYWSLVIGRFVEHGSYDFLEALFGTS